MIGFFSGSLSTIPATNSWGKSHPRLRMVVIKPMIVAELVSWLTYAGIRELASKKADPKLKNMPSPASAQKLRLWRRE